MVREDVVSLNLKCMSGLGRMYVHACLEGYLVGITHNICYIGTMGQGRCPKRVYRRSHFTTIEFPIT